MTIEGHRPVERGVLQESLIISPDFLFRDNHSSQAEANREQWEDVRSKGQLIAYYRCSDARLRPAGIGAMSWGKIAAAEKNPHVRFVTNKRIEVSIALTHFDGDTAIPGQMPTGCGGLGEKRKIEQNSHHNGIERFIFEEVAHEDVLIQAWFTAENVAHMSGKPSLAAAQDHLNLQIFPIALFLPQDDGEMLTISRVRSQDLIAKNYDPKRIYENGIPAISESSLPDVFQGIMKQNTKDIAITNSSYPNLRKMQKVQKPRTILWSTDVRSARVKYPVLSSPPGSIFKVIMPRDKIEGNVIITDEDIRKCLEQLEYPIKHALENHSNPDKAFSNTDRLIIETGSLNKSGQLAQRAMQEPWMKEWTELEDRKIIIVQSVAGLVADNIDYYKG